MEFTFASVNVKNSKMKKFTKRSIGPRFLAMTFMVFMLIQTGAVFAQRSITFPIVDTNEELFYDTIHLIDAPVAGEPYFGQDANYQGNQPSYMDNGDGTVTDLVTGLMWQQSPDFNGDGVINVDDKMSYFEAMAAVDTFSLAGYTDWRMPSLKEMYSLIVFSGLDPSGYTGTSTEDLVPFIDTDYFGFGYGDLNAGERLIDAQLTSSNLYVGGTMGGDETMFGVNFADGRIKGYGIGPMPGQTQDKQFYVMYVRGNIDYGVNDFVDNGDGTVTDNATGLMWQQDDSGVGMNWGGALEYAESTTSSDYSDWRLPNVKELQSIVDYTRAPSVTNSAAIDPIFNCSTITDEGGDTNYPFYWSGTTHANMAENASGGFGSYVCFGEALGWMEDPPMSGNYQLMDVHGAGAQRSDPKTGNPDDYPYGNGPQGDVVRIYNYVRLVRDVDTSIGFNDLQINKFDLNIYPNPANDRITLKIEGADNTEVLDINVFNVMGELCYSQNSLQGNSVSLNVKDYHSGIYFVNVVSNGITYSSKFVKQ